MTKEASVQTALVTGASGGVGRAISVALAGPGMTLILTGLNRERLKKVAQDAKARNSQIHIQCADLTEDYTIAQLADEVRRAGNGLDILVHSMGTITLGRIESAPVQDFDEQFRTNVRTPYLLTQALLPALRARRGQIVFINSASGLDAGAGVSQYAATKHALKALADSLRQEVNPDGIRVLSVFLGRTATPMQEAVHKAETRPYDASRLIQPDDVASAVVHSLRLNRTAEITDLRIRPEKKPPL